PPQDAQHQPGVVGGDPVDLPGDAAPERLLVVDGPDEEAEPRGVSAVDVPGGDVAAVDAQRVGPGSLRRVGRVHQPARVEDPRGQARGQGVDGPDALVIEGHHEDLVLHSQAADDVDDLPLDAVVGDRIVLDLQFD